MQHACHLNRKKRRNDMNKTKKSSPKTSQKNAIRDLDVTPVKGGSVRGGISKLVDKSSPVLIEKCEPGKH